MNLGVIFAMQGKIEKVVLGDELIEDIGGQNYGWRHGDANTGKAAGETTLAQ